MRGMGVWRLGRRRALAGAAGMVLAAPAIAQQRVKSGTVTIEQVQVAFIGSGNVGSGTLHFLG
jgi:glutamate dehydrogenase/leucine dehydrogenase